MGEYETDALNTCIEESSNLNKIKRSSLDCICGYVAHKEKNMIMDLNDIGSKNKSELLRNATREKLDFPKEELFDFSLHLYIYYKCPSSKACTNCLTKRLQVMSDYAN